MYVFVALLFCKLTNYDEKNTYGKNDFAEISKNWIKYKSENKSWLDH